MPALNQRIRRLRKDEFTIGAEIGRGGESIVYPANIPGAPDPNYYVAKKLHLLVDAANLGLEAHEVALIAAKMEENLNIWAAMPEHPNVLPLSAVHLDTLSIDLPLQPRVDIPNVPLYVFSPRYATTVDQWLQTRGRALSPADLVSKISHILQQAAAGLAHMHAYGIVHRDLKLNNLFCNDDATVVVVADLGLIKEDALTSKWSSISGNPQNMAPEMLFTRRNQQSGSAESQYSVTADVWSFAMLMFEMLGKALNDNRLENWVYNKYSTKVTFDPITHKPDRPRTAEQQAAMRLDVNAHLAGRYPPCIQDLFAMRTRQESGAASSLMEVALQLDCRFRGSMEHCLTALELAQCKAERDRQAAIIAAMAERQPAQATAMDWLGF